MFTSNVHDSYCRFTFYNPPLSPLPSIYSSSVTTISVFTFFDPINA
jgi:hypothetical protein